MADPIRYVWPPWDWVADPVSVPFALGRGGVDAGAIIPPYAFDPGAAFQVDVRTGIGFYFNVGEWSLDGSISITLNGPAETGTYAGPIHLVVPAVNYISDGPLDSPTLGGLALHGGWYGQIDTVPDWTFTPAGGGSPEVFDPGTIWVRLGERTSAPGSFPDGKLVFEPLASLPFCSVGKNSDDDNCEVTSSFAPIGGGADTGFTFRLGSTPASGDLPPTLTGSLTFNPTSLYTY